MSGKQTAFLILMLLAAGAALSTGVVMARDSGNASGYQLVRDSSGSMKLKITTETAAAGMWLGVTLYPPNAKVGGNQVLAVKPGKNINEMSIAPALNGGTFEVAVWTGKQSPQDCAPSDETCRKNGYKLIGMTSYLWGYLTTP